MSLEKRKIRIRIFRDVIVKHSHDALNSGSMALQICHNPQNGQQQQTKPNLNLNLQYIDIGSSIITNVGEPGGKGRLLRVSRHSTLSAHFP